MTGLPFTFVDAIQIAILYFAIYAMLKASRGTRFGQVLTGVGILFAVLLAFTHVFHFDVLRRIVQGLLIYLAVSPVVIFQPEIRKSLASLGSMIFQREERAKFLPEQVSDKLAKAVFRLAEMKRGALIAIERGISLRTYESSGIALDALVSPELLVTLFREPEPLHDGGVIVRNGRLAAAHCLFPVSVRPELISYGMRHRAAVGISEDTDALVVAVSEESGAVSIAHNGRITRYAHLDEATRQTISRRIRKAMPERKSVWEAVSERLDKAVARVRKGAKRTPEPTEANA